MRLSNDGCERVDSVLDVTTCASLRAHLRARHAAARSAELLSCEAFFGRIASPLDRRLDMRLSLASDAVRSALRWAVAAVAPQVDAFLAATDGDGRSDGVLCELSSLIALPAAARQPVHSDTTGDAAAIVTVFIALQDVTEEMGPTLVWPRTHSRASLGLRADVEWSGAAARVRARAALDGSDAPFAATLPAGAALIMDSRLAHCGGENRSNTERILLYFSVRAASRPGAGSTLSLLEEYSSHPLLVSFQWFYLIYF